MSIWRWVNRGIAVIALAGGLTACSSSDGGSSFSCDAQCQSDISAAGDGETAGSGSASPTIPPNGLTGYGATLPEWDEHHRADRDYTPGCCYGPQIEAPDNGGSASQWNLAGNAGDTVLQMIETFAPGTSDVDALDQIEASDLPSDANKSQAEGDGSCELQVYTSATLEKADPDASPVEVALYSSLDDTTYDRSDIERALFTPGDGSGGC